MTTAALAIVGMACRYPDASSPVELWENVLAQRQAFRRIPAVRLRHDDYFADDPLLPDRTYSTEAAVITDYAFDRVRYRIAKSTYESADLTHWLALDVAAQALADAGFVEGTGLPHGMTGVVVGNTLTGEFSRAHVLRLRWPYVRRVFEAALIEHRWDDEQRQAFLAQVEHRYKAPFPPVGEETLAGGLSNTIAGRICNYFDLHGGGFTVDGACASSLLAVAQACSALVAGDLDVAIAGGVDLSLDPFELVGFAKTGALAPEKMRVYDRRSAGFWPGEGCGFVVLMRHADALAQRRRIYATIRGWGVSSDGSGGITRPEVEGQRLALERAYRRAGFGAETVAYFEGHGTGTNVGDATELRALSGLRQATGLGAPPAVISSVKANIGHTKAAAGVAGLIKATMALHTQLLPPTVGCEQPHAELSGDAPALRVLPNAQLWPGEQPLRASVSAMGFGGINSHVVLEGAASARRRTLSTKEQILVHSAQDAELFLLGAVNATHLLQQLDLLLARAPQLARAELADLAAHLAAQINICHIRAAIVAATPTQLTQRLETVRDWLAAGETHRLDHQKGIFLGDGRTPRVGFLFPGQGSPAHLHGGALRRRFASARHIYKEAKLPQATDTTATAIAQPAIVTASIAGMRVLDQFGIMADVGLGHSLGELTALHWAGALTEEALLHLATVRGGAMADLGSPTGAMASIAAGYADVKTLLNGDPIVIAGINSPHQTVVSGEAAAVDRLVRTVEAHGLLATRLPVSHAFHSPLVAAAVPPVAEHLARMPFHALHASVISTVTGSALTPATDLAALLCEQITAPVKFMEAVNNAAAHLDLFIEVGPGHVLSRLAAECTSVPVVALDAGGPSLAGVCNAVGAAFALGVPVNHHELHAGRFTRPFDLQRVPQFFANPCEAAPVVDEAPVRPTAATHQLGEPVESAAQATPAPPAKIEGKHDATTPLDLVRSLVAERAELPHEAVRNESSLLRDLHLNSIAVSQLVATAARQLGLPQPASPTEYANATVAEVAEALDEQLRTIDSSRVEPDDGPPAGIASWIRAFSIELIERSAPPMRVINGPGTWQVFAPDNYPHTAQLQARFAQGGGDGVVVCLPPDPNAQHIPLLLDAAHTVLSHPQSTHFVLVQHGGGAAAFARTLHLEARRLTTCVIDLPFDHPAVAELVVREALSTTHYAEVSYDNANCRREPVLRLLADDIPSAPLPLAQNDVLLVTGGGKGITAECALALARETGAALALLGRSDPANDPELAVNLERIGAAGVAVRYVAADVTDAHAMQAAIRTIEVELGPVTGILHGAARNVPQLLATLDEAAFHATLAPKVDGLRHVLAAIDPAQIRVLIGFSSIIGRMGLRGEADYAVANEWLTREIEQWQQAHPACRCLSIEWSIWSEVGMGARLGGTDMLLRAGITPITPDRGIALFKQLLARALPGVATVVTGRVGEPPTLRVERPDLPFFRFLEQSRVFHYGIELVVDCVLTADTDPYLADHVFRGEQLLPAVLGLEAMAQTAMAVTGKAALPRFEQVQFNRPVIVPEQGTAQVRIAALVEEDGRVELALRCADTGFQVDHFRATCRFTAADADQLPMPDQNVDPALPPVTLDPDRDLYGSVLFQRGRFQRVRSYEHLAARACAAQIAEADAKNWFGRYLPPALALGDPGVRDAAIHAIQACVPNVALLPVGVEQVTFDNVEAAGPWRVQARERSRAGDMFTYDMVILAADGTVREHWRGLKLQIVGGTDWREPWVPALLGPYAERRVSELVPSANIRIVVAQQVALARQVGSDHVVWQALGQPMPLYRRPDGKPEAGDPRSISTAHAHDLSLAVAGTGQLGCDLEFAVPRSAQGWTDLLGRHGWSLVQQSTQETHEPETIGATRVWAATECLRKAGVAVDQALMLDTTADNWVVYAAGALRIATSAVHVRQYAEPLVLAVLVEKEHASV